MILGDTIMRRRLWAFLAMAAVALCNAPALADFDQSSAWFVGLSEDERFLLQARLILTGHYVALADGEFGQMTYRAIVALQRDLGDPQNGVLSEGAQTALNGAAAAIYQGLGMDIVTDERGLITLIVPNTLLPQRLETRRGTAYVSPDGAVRLETIRKPLTEQSFADLYDGLRSETATRKVSYAVFDPGRFVVSGTAGERSFYMYFTSTPEDSIGYSMEWLPEERDTGSMLATFLASYSYPTAFDEDIKTDSYATLPASPSEPSKAAPGGLSAGSGFFVNDDGLIVTNNHVVEGCSTLTVPGYGQARIMSTDSDLDLAAIKIEGEPKAWATIRTTPVELGEDVVMLGYPLADIMGSSLAVGTGIVSSETGLGGSPQWFTSNVGLQPGNSGGPILDARGLVVGVAVAKLDDGVMMADTGNVAPNFGFAIKNSELIQFLSVFRTDALDESGAKKAPSVRDLVRGAKDYTVQVLCRS